MNASILKQHLGFIVEMAYKSIHAQMDALVREGKHELNNNDDFGQVSIVELKDTIWLKRWKVIRGVAMKGFKLFLYVQDTSGGKNSDTDRLSGADYIVPFEDVKELTPHMLTEVLAALEKQ